MTAFRALSAVVPVSPASTINFDQSRWARAIVNDSDTGFAWQALAGVRAPLNDRIDVGLKYRFFNANSVDLVDTGGRALRNPLAFAQPAAAR